MKETVGSLVSSLSAWSGIDGLTLLYAAYVGVIVLLCWCVRHYMLGGWTEPIEREISLYKAYLDCPEEESGKAETLRRSIDDGIGRSVKGAAIFRKFVTSYTLGLSVILTTLIMTFVDIATATNASEAIAGISSKLLTGICLFIPCILLDIAMLVLGRFKPQPRIDSLLQKGKARLRRKRGEL